MTIYGHMKRPKRFHLELTLSLKQLNLQDHTTFEYKMFVLSLIKKRRQSLAYT